MRTALSRMDERRPRVVTTNPYEEMSARISKIDRNHYEKLR